MWAFLLTVPATAAGQVLIVQHLRLQGEMQEVHGNAIDDFLL